MISKIKKPDVKAPRYREEVHAILNKKLITDFKSKFPQYQNVDDDKLKQIILTFNTLIWKNAVTSRDGSEFPEGLGYIFIGTCKSPKKFNVNYEYLKQTDNVTRHRNFESDNYLAKIFYTNFANKYKFHCRDLWQFKGYRDFKRAVAVEYPLNWQKYLQVDNYILISKIFKIGLKKNFLMNRDIKVDDTYNEFDIN